MSAPLRRIGKLTPEDFIELRDWMLVCLVPLFVENSVITDEEACLICLDGTAWGGDDEGRQESNARFDTMTEILLQRVDDSPKGQALALFVIMSMQMLYLNLAIAKTCDSCIERSEEWRATLLEFESKVWTADGYMRAMTAVRDAHMQRSQSGAEKRREIGERARQKVSIEADRYRGNMTRDRAAFDIGEAVSMSPSRVRKLLSELFPGNKWNEPKPGGK